jgi:hypothetical protein
MVSLRSDRRHFFEGEETAFEAWICNDLNSVPTGYLLKYQVEKEGKIVFANQAAANIPTNSSRFQGFIKWKTPHVSNRTTYTLLAALVNEKEESTYQNKFEFEVFPKPDKSGKKVFVAGNSNGKAEQLIQQAGCNKASSIETADVILIDDFTKYAKDANKINELVFHGKTVLFIELGAQQYDIANTTVSVEKTSMGDYYFVSPETGHPLVKNFKPFDFRFWYDEKKRLIEPIIAYTISAPGWAPILSSGATNWLADKGTVMAAGELKYGKGVFRLCEVQLVDRIDYNPSALIFLNALLNN